MYLIINASSKQKKVLWASIVTFVNNYKFICNKCTSYILKELEQ